MMDEKMERVTDEDVSNFDALCLKYMKIEALPLFELDQKARVDFMLKRDTVLLLALIYDTLRGKNK